MVGRLGYSIKEVAQLKPLQGWNIVVNAKAARLLFQRYAVARDKTNTQVYFQLNYGLERCQTQ